MAKSDGTTGLNLSAGVASVSVAITLVSLKLWALGATSALSVAASLADSSLDLMMSLGGLMAIVYAARPADDDHAFGHTSVEDLAALAQSVFLVVASVVISWAAISRLLTGHQTALASEERGILVMVISIFLTFALILWQRRVARRTGNRVVAADSLHYMSDLIPSLGAIAALWMSRNYGIGQVDSIVALAAALLLLLGAIRIGKGAWDALMDRRADPALIAAIGDMARDWPGVLGYHDLKTRMAGSRVFVNIHIELNGDQSLREAHAIGAGLRRKIIETWPQCDVIVHKDVARET
ncbi:MAG: cation diffusion facilitator family transporter [Paracoccaceae bacterium]|nr:cation diffusion facilitator family transporter [Paracoccaceae bacterium]